MTDERRERLQRQRAQLRSKLDEIDRQISETLTHGCRKRLENCRRDVEDDLCDTEYMLMTLTSDAVSPGTNTRAAEPKATPVS